MATAPGIDICVTSTQKGLNIPPGLSILFISKRLEGYEYAHRGYYWDFEDNLGNLKKGADPVQPGHPHLPPAQREAQAASSSGR